MKQRLLAASGVVLMLAACQSDPAGDHAHAAEMTLSYTIWTDEVELFAEFPPLVVGQVSRFAAHFTRLSDYKPLTEGQLTVSLVVGSKGIRQTVPAPSSPGIFSPSLQPAIAGTGQLIFELEAAGLSERIVLEDVMVYPAEEDAIAAMEEEDAGATIDFLKEQAWKIPFEVLPVQKGSISETIRTTGEIRSMHSDEQIVAAPSSGLVAFANSSLAPGKEVRKGEWLFTLVPTGDPDENLESRLEEAKATLQRAEAEYQRRKTLLEQAAISRKDFEATELEYRLAKVELENLMNYLSEGGRKVYAARSGFIMELEAGQGAYVETGDPVLLIGQTRRLQLVADLPQAYFPQIRRITTAEFRTAYDSRWQSIENYNGRMIAHARAVDPDHPFIPLYFELDNTGSLLPGSYVELLLHVGKGKETLVVPRTALLEDFGNYWVMVQRSGESFEKRSVRPGLENGSYVEVVEGLMEGERVVTQGAYQVKMASMASSLPAHGHTH